MCVFCIQLCKPINAAFHKGTSHLQPLALESVWKQKLIKPNANALLWKSPAVCMCHISMPSCTSSVQSSRRHQRSCERKASAFADTEHTTASDSLFIPERDRALLFHFYLHPTGRLIRNSKAPDVLLHANAGNFTCSFSSPLLSFRLTLELVMSSFLWSSSSSLILRPRAGEFLLFYCYCILHTLPVRSLE